MSLAVQVALYLRPLLEDFNGQRKNKIAIREDNQSFFQFPVMHKKSNYEEGFCFHSDKTEDWTFQFATLLLTKWQRTFSHNLYPYQRWKIFGGTSLLRNQLKSFGGTQKTFGGTSLYAISLSLSGGVRMSIETMVLTFLRTI